MEDIRRFGCHARGLRRGRISVDSEDIEDIADIADITDSPLKEKWMLTFNQAPTDPFFSCEFLDVMGL